MESNDARAGRNGQWVPRPILTLVVRALCLAIPLAAGLLAGALAAEVLPDADGLDRLLWWLAVLAVAVAATLAADALARRLLPLTALLRLTLAFPDHAPSRLRVALRAANVQRLRARVADAEHERLPDAERAADIVALAAALNAHDRRTRGHSERVQALARLVAQQLHLDRAEQDRLGWAAFLHDIGKLGVPPALLNKPGPPDEDEWAVLRRHPEEGARLVAPLRSWLGDAAGAIGDHHERYDGTGYPRGLVGEEISPAGRIVAVVDAYETLTAARAYKRPASPAAARAEVTRCAGTHFDPHVVRAFLGVSLGRLRWVVGLAGFLALVPVLQVTRARAASLRPAVTGSGTGAVGAAVASLVLATSSVVPPTTSPPPTPSVTPAAAGVAGSPAARPVAAAAAAASSPLVRVQLDAAGLRVTAALPGGVAVGAAPAPGLGLDLAVLDSDTT